jgi:Inverse autotransporter, beta-domain
MNTSHRIIAAVSAIFALSATAGQPDTTGKLAKAMTEVEPFGKLTLGGKSAEDLQSGYLDVLSGLYRTDNAALFLNLRGTFDDNDQQVYSVGLGFRYLIEDPGIILGANAYYDHVDSAFSNGINQFGFGAEVLTKWVDARFNYYLPENDRHLVRTFSVPNTVQTAGPLQLNGNQFQRQVNTTTTTTTFGIFEQGLEGWNAEAGVLVPGLESWMELRLFAGAYNYQDPKGGDIGGFKARAEARVTEGITLDLEYWEDEELVGGNWVGGVRVSLPFDVGALFTGRNPFEGAGDAFRPIGSRSMRSRMDEMVIRSHRIQTNLTSPEPLGTTTNTSTKTLSTTRSVIPPVTAPPTGGSPETPPEGQSEVPPEGSGDVPPEGGCN